MKYFKLEEQHNSVLFGFIAFGLITLLVTFYMSTKEGWALLLVCTFFLFILSISGGFFTALQFVSGSKWSVVIRRIPEVMVETLPFIFFLVLVIALLGSSELYHWVHYEHCKISNDCTGFTNDHVLDNKQWYLNKTFFIARLVGSFLFLYILGMWLKRKSVTQDSLQNITEQKKSKTILTRISAGYIVAMAYVFTLVSIDLLMSLEPHWYSTMFPIYTFAGLGYSGMSMWIIIIYIIQNQNFLKEVTPEHYHDLGKFLFMFTIFWAYIAFSQFMLIWYANLPEETLYLEKRFSIGVDNPWSIFTTLLWLGHFIIPLFVLLSRGIKRNPKSLFSVACFTLFMGFVDIVWLVYGGLDLEKNFPLSWNEIGAFIGSLGIFGYLFFRSLAKVNVIPVSDPDLQESLHFHQLH